MTHQEQVLVDWRGLRAMGIPYCRAHIYRLIEEGRFPEPIKLGTGVGGRVAWYHSDVLNWIEACRLASLRRRRS